MRIDDTVHSSRFLFYVPSSRFASPFPSVHMTEDSSDPLYCIKATIAAVNVIFLIFGAVLASVGSAASSNQFAAFTGDTVPTGLLVIGIFVIVFSLLGCCGAKMESLSVLYLYVIILAMLILCQLGVGMAVYIEQDQMNTVITAGWDRATDPAKSLVQNNLECCGLITFNMTLPINLPAGATVSGLAVQPCPPKSIPPMQVCMPLILSVVQSSYTTAAIVAIVFAFLEIAGLLFAAILIRTIKITKEQLI